MIKMQNLKELTDLHETVWG